MKTTKLPAVDNVVCALLSESTTHSVTGLDDKLPYGEELIKLFTTAEANGMLPEITVRLEGDARHYTSVDKWDIILLPTPLLLLKTEVALGGRVFATGRIANGNSLQGVRIGFKPTGVASLSFVRT
jgi:hypothetical protein